MIIPVNLGDASYDMILEPGDEEAALVGEHRVLGGKSSVLVALGIEQFFRAGGEEECRIDDVRADDGLVLCRLLYHGAC